MIRNLRIHGPSRATALNRSSTGRGLGVLLSIAAVNCGEGTPVQADTPVLVNQELVPSETGQPGGNSSGGATGTTLSSKPIAGSAGQQLANRPSEVTSIATISEVKFDPPGVDGNFEFIELRGDSSARLDGYWLVAVEGDNESNRGQIDVVIELSDCGEQPCRFDEGGLLLLAPDPSIHALPSASASRPSPEVAKGALENGTTSLLLVRGGVSTKDLHADWDIDDDGSLELPHSAMLVDGVTWTDGDSADLGYASITLGPRPKAQALWRCTGDGDWSEWRYGPLLGDSPSLLLDVANCSPSGLPSATLSPGATNDCARALTLSNAGDAGSAGVSNPGASAGSSGLVSSVYFAGAAGSGFGVSIYAGGRSASQSATSSPLGAPKAGASSSTGAATTFGGRVTAPAQTSGGVRAEPTFGAGDAGMSFIVATAAVADQGGNSGWWSSSPFPPSRAGQTSTDGRGGAPGDEAKPSGTAQPPLPSTCVMSRQTVRPSSFWFGVLLLLGVRGVVRLRPR